MRRAFALGAVFGALAGLSACALLPEPIEGVERADEFIAFPVRAWMVRDDVRPISVAGCLVEPCAARVGLGVFDMTGAARQGVQRIVERPALLAADIAERDGRDRTEARRAITPVVTSAPLAVDGARGFQLSMARPDGTRAAHGVALTRVQGPSIRVVLAVADDPALALSAARQAASAYFR